MSNDVGNGARSLARDIFIQKNGKQAGPYTLEALNQMLAEGQIHGADYGWYEGLQDWIQIKSLEGVVCRPSQSPPPFKPQVIADNQQMPHGRDDTDDEVIFLKYKKSLGVAIFFNILWAGAGCYYCKAQDGKWIASANVFAFFLSFFALGLPCFLLFIWACVVCNRQVEICNLELRKAIRDGAMVAFKQKYEITD